MLGTASSLKALNGANDAPEPLDGGVCGKNRQKTASPSDAIPATVNVQASAASIAGPVFRVPSAFPSHETQLSPWPCAGTFAQSIGMKMSGQAAAIQPNVPHTRMNPKSFWASLMFAKAMAFVIEIVGT